MQDSIVSDFLRNPCFVCELHFKINLAQLLIRHRPRFLLLQITPFVFLSASTAAVASELEGTFTRESLIMLSQFPLLPNMASGAARQHLLQHRCFCGDDPWRHKHRNVDHETYLYIMSKEEREFYFYVSFMRYWLNFLHACSWSGLSCWNHEESQAIGLFQFVSTAWGSCSRSSCSLKLHGPHTDVSFHWLNLWLPHPTLEVAQSSDATLPVDPGVSGPGSALLFLPPGGCKSLFLTLSFCHFNWGW